MNCGRDGHRAAVVVLAAGSSKRFGEDKMLSDFDGKPLILHSVGNAIASDADSVIVVVNDGGGPVMQKLPRGVTVAVNNNPSGGMSSSIIAGLSSIGSDSCSCIILAGDQPFVSSEMLNALINAHKHAKDSIVSYRYNGRVRNPVLFPRSMFDAICQLKGDEGARKLVVEAESETIFIDVEDGRLLLDIDTEEDLSVAESFLRETRKTTS